MIGLDFLVASPNEFVMRQRMPGVNLRYCASRVIWRFCICEGCNCPKMNMADIKISHTMTKLASHDAGAACNTWFTKIDEAIRGYTSSVRAAILSLKTACCVPWTPKNDKKGQCVYGHVTGQAAGTGDRVRPPGAPYVQQLYLGGRARPPYDPIRDCSNVICKNENFPGIK